MTQEPHIRKDPTLTSADAPVTGTTDVASAEAKDRPALAVPFRWDIFCRVIDNFGDIGVCWRLAHQLAQGGARVRLWVDDPGALSWMAPVGCEGVEVRVWGAGLDLPADLPPSDVLIEAFGCDIPEHFVRRWVDWRRADGQSAAWFNLEYLSAEAYVERSHGLPSPIMSGPARGWSKTFFYPGFTARTGGLLREPHLLERQARFKRQNWLAAQGLVPREGQLLVSLFCYEPSALPGLMERLAQMRAMLLVTPGRARAAVEAARIPPGLDLGFLPWLTQDDFDHLLWSCDLNFVRGEDSLVRALWAGQAFVWQIYPQDDGVHADKLVAFLDRLGAPPSLRHGHLVWNGLQTGPMPPLEPQLWGDFCRRTRADLLLQTDLVGQLVTRAGHILQAPKLPATQPGVEKR